MNEDDCQMTALHWAAIEGDCTKIKNLVEADKMLLKSVNSQKRTPLLLAIISYKTDASLLLLDLDKKPLTPYGKGWNTVNMQDINGMTALHYTAMTGQFDLAKALLKAFAYSLLDNQRNTPLHLAAIEGHSNIVELLKQFRASVTARNVFGQTPLHCAVTNQHFETILALHDTGILHSGDAQGATPLSIAISLKQPKYITAIYGSRARPEDFLKASIEAGQLDPVKSLFESGQKINYEMLTIAVKSVNSEITKYLIDNVKSYDPYKLSEKGWSLLHLTCDHGQTSHINILLSTNRGHQILNLCTTDADKETALHKAIRKGHSDVVTELLKYNPNLEIRNAYNDTALSLAIHSQKAEIVHILLEAGANYGVSNKNGRALLEEAIFLENERIIKYLLLAHFKDGRLPSDYLRVAITKGQEMVVKAFLENCEKFQFDINWDHIKTAAVKTPINKANILELLLEYGQRSKDIDINMTVNRWTLLHYATDEKMIDEEHQIDIVGALLKYNAEINIAIPKSKYPTALAIAVKRGNSELVNFLIDNNSDLNTTNTRGETPLWIAVKNLDARIVRLLLKAGANPNIKDKYGVSSFQLALYLGGEHVKDELKKYNLRPKPGDGVLCEAVILGKTKEVIDLIENKLMKIEENHFLNAAYYGYLDIMEILLRNDDKWKFDVNSITSDNSSVLHYATEEGHFEIVKLLLEKVDPNLVSKNKKHATALHCAISKGYDEIIHLLISDKRIQLEITNMDDETPLWEAFKQCNYVAIETLISKGANKRIRNKSGMTLFDLVQQKENALLLKLLISAPNTENPYFPDSEHIMGYMDKIALVMTMLQSGIPLKYEHIKKVVRSGLVDIIKIIAKTDYKNSRNNYGKSILCLAVELSEFSIVEILLKNDVDLLPVDNNGDCMMHYTAYQEVKFAEAFISAPNMIDSLIDLKNNQHQTPLWMATIANNFPVVEALINAGCDPNTVDITGTCAFDIALSNQNANIVNCLLKKGVEPKLGHLEKSMHFNDLAIFKMLIEHEKNRDLINAFNDEGSTLLHTAASKGCSETVDILLGNGANPFMPNKSGYCAIHYAAKNGFLRIVDTFIDYDRYKNVIRSIDVKCKMGETSLIHALKNMHSDVAILFLEAGSNPNVKDSKGMTAINIASSLDSKNEHLLSKLLHYGAKVDENFLSDAIRHGKVGVVRALIDNGWNVNHQQFLLAAEFGHRDVIRYLLNEDRLGFTVNDHINGRTALHWAAEKGFSMLAEDLLERDADPNIHIADENGLCPLHIAVVKNNLDIIDVFKAKFEKLDFKSKQNFTPLYLAARDGLYEAVLKLSEGDCVNINDKNCDNNWTALHVAIDKNHSSIVNILLERGADPKIQSSLKTGWNSLHKAIVDGKIEIVNSIIKARSDVINLKTKHGLTPLHLACSYGHIEIVKALLEAGCSVNDVDKTGQSALHIAVINEQNEIIEMLLNFDANSDIGTKECGWRPLHIIVRIGRLDMLEIFLAKNCKVDVKSSNNITPLDIANMLKQSKIKELLQKKLDEQNLHQKT